MNFKEISYIVRAENKEGTLFREYKFYSRKTASEFATMLLEEGWAEQIAIWKETTTKERGKRPLQRVKK